MCYFQVLRQGVVSPGAPCWPQELISTILCDLLHHTLPYSVTYSTILYHTLSLTPPCSTILCHLLHHTLTYSVTYSSMPIHLLYSNTYSTNTNTTIPILVSATLALQFRTFLSTQCSGIVAIYLLCTGRKWDGPLNSRHLAIYSWWSSIFWSNQGGLY